MSATTANAEETAASVMRRAFESGQHPKTTDTNAAGIPENLASQKRFFPWQFRYAWIARNELDVSGPHDYQGGRKWLFNDCPMCDHGDDGPFLIQYASGAIAAGCHHDSCKDKWRWKELRAKFKSTEPKRERKEETPRKPIERIKFAELRKRYPKLKPPVIDGLKR